MPHAADRRNTVRSGEYVFLKHRPRVIYAELGDVRQQTNAGPTDRPAITGFSVWKGEWELP